jgi:hypothetical protein
LNSQWARRGRIATGAAAGAITACESDRGPRREESSAAETVLMAALVGADQFRHLKFGRAGATPWFPVPAPPRSLDTVLRCRPTHPPRDGETPPTKRRARPNRRRSRHRSGMQTDRADYPRSQIKTVRVRRKWHFTVDGVRPGGIDRSGPLSGNSSELRQPEQEGFGALRRRGGGEADGSRERLTRRRRAWGRGAARDFSEHARGAVVRPSQFCS